MAFNALILAGSRGGHDPLSDYAGVADKALIRIGDETMLAHVVDALRQAGAARILVSASSEPVKAAAAELGVDALPAASGPSLSARQAFDLAGAPLLVTTADHALLEPDWIRDFLADVPADADVAVLLARRETIERDAAGTKRTYLRFADGDWSGCNLFLLATPRAGAAIDLWAQVEKDRKRPWRIVRKLGLGTLFRFVAGRLSLAQALGKLGALCDLRAAVVSARSGLAAVDVDKPADLDFVRAHLASRLAG